MALNLVRGVALTPKEKETMLDLLTPPPSNGTTLSWWRRWPGQWCAWLLVFLVFPGMRICAGNLETAVRPWFAKSGSGLSYDKDLWLPTLHKFDLVLKYDQAFLGNNKWFYHFMVIGKLLCRYTHTHIYVSRILYLWVPKAWWDIGGVPSIMIFIQLFYKLFILWVLLFCFGHILWIWELLTSPCSFYTISYELALATLESVCFYCMYFMFRRLNGSHVCWAWVYLHVSPFWPAS